MAQLPSLLAEPFSQIFVDRAEAEWAFDLLRDTAKRLGIQGAYDPRFALTLAHRSGRLGLHLNFGGWLVIGFHGPGLTPVRVDLALLAHRVSWDERFSFFPFAHKEGEPEVRSYHLPLEMVRPMTSDLQATYLATLDFMAQKFSTWKRAVHWQRHNPEIAEALFKPEQRERIFAGLLTEPELRYERHLTAFYQDLSEEREEYEVEEVEIEAEAKAEAEGIVDLEEVNSEYLLQRRSDVRLNQIKVDELVLLVRRLYPNWSNFSDPDFMKDEVEYKQAAIVKARELLSEAEFKRLITEKKFDDVISRLDKIGKSTNLLFLDVPKSGDLSILYHPELDKPLFSEVMFDLLYGPGPSSTRLESYINYIQARQLPNKWTFPTYFLFIFHPNTEMFVKPQTTKWFMEFVGIKDNYSSKPTELAYATVVEIARQLKDGLQNYQPRDMVDIQSFIWVCYSARQPKEKDEHTESELAEPFSQIFKDREEAEWAFDFLRETFERLGIKDPNDLRFALTLPYNKRRLRLDLGNWGILTFRGSQDPSKKVSMPFIVDQVELGQNLQTYNYAQKGDEPDIREYTLLIEMVRSLAGNLQATYKATLDHIGERFRNYGQCPWRNRYHVSEIAEAVFNLEKREKLLTEGLSKEIETTIEYETGLNFTYSLSQLAEDTGLDEAELARWGRAIERKGQAILYGPPGTGKTFIAEKLAQHLVSGGDGFVELVQFHPAYAYEDFIQGIRPQSEGDHLSYPLVPGRFLEFCQKAQGRDISVLIIDEINRANLSRVFGELMYLLEYRNRSIPLAGGGYFTIPANVRLIGTMNTADRSIALVDHALRRRFAFIALYPIYELLRRYHQREQTGFELKGLIDTLKELNQQIGDPNYAVGVTFFFNKQLASELEDIWRMEIEPYLEEFFLDQEKVTRFRWAAIQQKVLP